MWLNEAPSTPNSSAPETVTRAARFPEASDAAVAVKFRIGRVSLLCQPIRSDRSRQGEAALDE